MEIMHIQKYISTSPRKLRLVADLVRGVSPVKSLQVLKFTNKAAAGELSKAIKTAIANAKQVGVAEETLNFKALEVNEAMKLVRVRSGGRGRRRLYKKKSSHIKVVLTDELKKEGKEELLPK